MIRMAVLGDSVAWGQGLQDPNKYASIVLAQLDPTGTGQLTMTAHSGAVIGAQGPPAGGKVGPEVPSATPTIRNQVDSVPNPGTVDLVLLNGGINDVTIQAILAPFTSNDDLRTATEKACHDDMILLLKKAVGRFVKPSCQFIVTGYYPILSTQSSLKEPGSTNLDLLLNHHGLPLAAYMNRTPIIDLVVSHALQFWRDSDVLLGGAVAETQAALGLGGRIAFVPSGFTESNALFAPMPFLFGFDPVTLGTQDLVPAERERECREAYPTLLDFLDCEVCRYASVGHPNTDGALRFANAILNQLQPDAPYILNKTPRQTKRERPET